MSENEAKDLDKLEAEEWAPAFSHNLGIAAAWRATLELAAAGILGLVQPALSEVRVAVIGFWREPTSHSDEVQVNCRGVRLEFDRRVRIMFKIQDLPLGSVDERAWYAVLARITITPDPRHPVSRDFEYQAGCWTETPASEAAHIARQVARLRQPGDPRPDKEVLRGHLRQQATAATSYAAQAQQTFSALEAAMKGGDLSEAANLAELLYLYAERVAALDPPAVSFHAGELGMFATMIARAKSLLPAFVIEARLRICPPDFG